MKRGLKSLLAGAALVAPLLAGGPALAQPTLQLDILNGVYDDTTDTIVATSDQFTLYALLIPDQDTTLADTFYISAAITPKIGPADSDLGSFTFNGTTIDVTADMVYGTAPIEADLTHDPGDLPKHGIFETFYTEFAFTFDPNNTALAYNTQDDAGQGPTPDANGTMYFEDFLVDVSGLDSPYRIHFDAYTKIAVNGDIDIEEFVPPSHDAESGVGNGDHRVPEPGTMALLGAALCMGAVVRRYRL